MIEKELINRSGELLWSLIWILLWDQLEDKILIKRSAKLLRIQFWTNFCWKIKLNYKMIIKIQLVQLLSFTFHFWNDKKWNIK